MINKVITLVVVVIAFQCASGAPVGDQNICQACRNLILFRNRVVEKMTNDELREKMIDWCEKSGAGATKSICTKMVNDLVSVFQRIPADKFCETIKVCPKEIAIVGTTLPSTILRDNTSCNFCVNTMNHVKGIVASKETEMEFKSLLVKYCRYLGSFDDECVQLLDDNLDSIFTYMRDKLNSTEFCEEIGACTASVAETNKLPDITDVLNLFPQGGQESSEIIPFVNIERTATKVEVTVPKSIECDMCQRVMVWLIQEIKENQTEAAIMSALDRVCESTFPQADVAKCEAYVKEYTALIIETLTQQVDPQLACSVMGVCPSKGNNKPVVTVERTVTKVEAELPKSVECILCTRVMTWLMQELRENTTEDAIVSALDEVCQYTMPTADKAKCEAFVQQYTEQIINILTQTVDPELACALMSVCLTDGKRIGEIERNEAGGNVVEIPDHDDRQNDIEGNVETSGIACFECQQIMHFLQTEVVDYRNEAEVRKWFESNVCDRVPSQVARETCQSFIEQYGNSILELVGLKIFDPNTVCDKELKVCPTSGIEINAATTNPKTDVEFIEPKGGRSCDVCISVVDKLDELIETDGVDKNVDKLVEKICSSLPKEKESQCASVVETYLPHFHQVMSSAKNAREVCESVDVCVRPGQVQLLGGEKCTFGPTYWCHTAAHADSCKATDYCKTKVWKAIE